MPDGLAAFIAARLDEAEQNISYAGPARIAWLTCLRDDGQMDYTTIAAVDDNGPWCVNGRELPEPASVRVVWDPARELRAITAKRAILARYERGTAGDLPEWTAGRELIEAGLAVLLGAMRDLAAEWNDHPAYQPEWSPNRLRPHL